VQKGCFAFAVPFTDKQEEQATDDATRQQPCVSSRTLTEQEDATTLLGKS
jgi:hypothetical protein